MKLTKRIISILVVLFSICVCGFFATAKLTTAKAESEVSLTVEAKNLAYSDSVYIAYAVSYEGFDSGAVTVKMLFWDSVQDEYVLGTEKYQGMQDTETATVNEKECLVFYSKGIPAKNMTDDLYSRAYVEIDGKEYYSSVQKYSVLEYVQSMFERDSDEDPDNDLRSTQKNLFNALLNYGAAAQEFFEYKTDRLANDTYYNVQVENGKLSDGFTSGRYKAGESFTITANEPAESDTFSHWEDGNGNIVGTESVCEVTISAENVKYIAVYQTVDNNYYNLEVENGTFADGQISGSYKSGTKIVITASEPAEGMEFSHWEDKYGEIVSKESVYEVTIAHEDAKYIAVYKEIGSEWADKDNVFPFPLEWAGIETETALASALSYSALMRTVSMATTFSQTQSQTNLAIEAKNLAYSDSVYIAYAVSYEGFDSSAVTVKMLFWDSVQDEYVLGTEKYQGMQDTKTVTINGKECLVFYSKGIPAKNMTDDIYSRAYVEIDGKEYYSSVQKYSVLEYVQSMFERDSDEDPDNDLRSTQINLFNALLNYGAAAQEFFEYKTDRLANDTYYNVQVENGKLSDGFTSGRYKAGESLTITANEPAEGYRFSHWEDANGNLISEQSVYECTVGQANVQYTAVYELKPVVGDVVLTSAELTYDATTDQLDLPNTITFEYDGQTIELAVVWNTQDFDSQIIGEQNIYATLVDSSAYAEYGINDIYMTINVLDYSLEYNSNTQTYSFTGYYGGESEYQVLSSYNGIEIVAIGANAFASNTSLTSVTIPASVTSIGADAFNGCSSLTKVDYLGTIDGWAQIEFNNANSNPLTCAQNLYISGILVTNATLTATSISAYAFYNCTSIEEITISDSVTAMGGYVFSGWSALQTIYCSVIEKPSDWDNNWNADCSAEVIWAKEFEYTLINNDAEYSVTGYTGTSEEVVIPEIYQGKSVTKIGDSVFASNTLITSIEIPSSVTSIGLNAFNGCTGLAKVNYLGTIDQWVEISFANVQSNPLYHTKALHINNELVTDIQLTTATSISNYALYYMQSLTSIEISNTVTSIGEYAFRFCNAIVEIVIPDSVQSIGQYAFCGCTLLETVVLPNGITSLESHLFQDCKALKSIVIPRSVTNIADLVFYNTTALTSIYIPITVVTMGAGKTNGVIRGCSTSLKIYCEADSIPSGWATKWNYNNRTVTWGYASLINIAEQMSALSINTDVISLDPIAFNNAVLAVKSEFEALDSSIKATYFTNSGAQYLSAYNNYTQALSLYNNVYSFIADIVNLGDPTELTLDKYAKVYALIDEYNALSDTYKNIVIDGGFKQVLDTAKQTVDELKEANDDGFDYVLINNETAYEIVGYRVKTKNVVIPSEYDGIPVTSIGGYAFSGLDITSVEIPDSVTNIGEFAFNGCTSLLTVTIGSGVTSIPYAMFNNCAMLQTVTMEGNVKSIGAYALYNCKALSSIALPSTVLSIGDYAFYQCGSLTSITIPSATTSIGYRAFTYCSSLTIYCVATSEPSDWVEGWNSTNCSIVWDCNNSSTDADGNIYVTSNGIKYAIKDGVATVVRQPNTITSATIASTITYKGSSYAVTSIEARAFYGCALTSVSISGNITSIGDYAFYNCDSLTSVTIPSSVKAIGKYAFSQCNELQSVSLPANVEKIGSYAFRGCAKLAYTEENGVKYLGNSSNKYIYLAEITDDTITSLTINSSCRIIGSYVFTSAINLTSIEIPASVVYMGHEVFYKCYALTIKCRATSGAGFEEDWNYANNPVVWNCANNDVADDGYIYVVVDGVRYALNDTTGKAMVVRQPQNITSATIPERVSYNGDTYIVNKISDRAFYNCTSLASVSLPDTLEYVGIYVFEGCNLTYNIYGNLYYLGNSSNPYLYLATTDAVTINNPTLNANCKFIGDSAFVNAKTLKIITIPASIINIGANAFYGRSSLATVTFASGSQLKSIGNNAFYNCSSLTGLVIPDSVESIGQKAFYGCSKLASITLPSSLTSIEAYAFENCVLLTSVHIPSEVQYIDFFAFNGCTALQYVTIDEENEMTYIEDCAFLGCSSLLEITIPDSVTYIGMKAFKDCSSLTDVTLSSSLTEIKDYAFCGCSSLTEIIIPSGVKEIGIYAFNDCTSLNSVTFEAGSCLLSIGEYAFYNCKVLRTIIIPSTVLVIDDYAFSHCSLLNSVTFEDGSQLTSIGYQAFSYSSLTSIIIPASVENVSYGIVAGCSISRIYCRVSSKPAGWHNQWNWLGSKSASVTWGYTG